MQKPQICVVGSSNIDLVTYAPRLPQLGESVFGTKFQIGFGGKGANQAVMAAKLGAEVLMVTKVGNDTFGRDTLENYRALGFDTRFVLTTDESFTGVAPIWVDGESGDNAIIVAAGANELLSPEDITRAKEQIAQTKMVVCQLECQLETSLAALKVGRDAGILTILNPAPARQELPDEAYQLSDIFCPNESETELLTGMPVETVEQATEAANVLRSRGAKTVILTLGERGSLLVNDDETTLIPTSPVRAIDTTGAGDAFVGSLSYFLAVGLPLPEAMARANQVAAISVQSPGTQLSYPERSALPQELLAILG
ncbi:MAG: ribokinase [Chloroflexota bacterium]